MRAGILCIPVPRIVCMHASYSLFEGARKGQSPTRAPVVSFFDALQFGYGLLTHACGLRRGGNLSLIMHCSLKSLSLGIIPAVRSHTTICMQRSLLDVASRKLD